MSGRSDIPLLSGPVGQTQLGLEDLARRVRGEGIDELDQARLLERRQASIQEGENVIGGEGVTGPEDHESQRLLTEVRLRDTDYGTVLHVRMLDNGCYDLRRIDVYTTGDDHVLDPVSDEQEPVLVEVPHVASPVEAVLHHVLAQRFASQVTLEHHGGIHRDLAGLAVWEPIPFV